MGDGDGGAGHVVLHDGIANVCPSVECDLKRYFSTDIETPNFVS